MDTESEPFEGEAEAPESPHTVASPTSVPDSTPPTCCVQESEGFGTFGARSTSLDSTTPLLPDHPLTHTTSALVLSPCRTARMAVRVLHVMAAMSDLVLWGELGEKEDEEVEESSDSDRKDEGPTAGDEGLAARDGDPDMIVKSLGLGRDDTMPERQ
nr:hypothetical protein [Tanacetum cinerariifolium]